MSQLITLNTKKDGSFDAYFEDTIKIPARAEVAFIKTLGCNIKYSSYEYITIGFIPDEDYDKNLFRYNIDGVNVPMSAQNLYDGYVALSAGPGVESPVIIDVFYSGSYRWSLDATKPNNVVAAFSHALNERFTFYEVEPSPLISFEIGNSDRPMISRFGLLSYYSNNKRLDPASIDGYIQEIQGLTVYQGSATLEDDKITSTADQTTVYSTNNLAINGGLVEFNVPNAKKCKVGIIFNNVTDQQNTTILGTSPELDFGIDINEPNFTYNVIRKNPYSSQMEIMPGVNTYSRGGVRSNNFSFIFSRTAEPEATEGDTEYTVFLLQGWDSNDPDLKYEDYIVARQKKWLGVLCQPL
jgi:hypothetical protein